MPAGNYTGGSRRRQRWVEAFAEREGEREEDSLAEEFPRAIGGYRGHMGNEYQGGLRGCNASGNSGSLSRKASAYHILSLSSSFIVAAKDSKDEDTRVKLTLRLSCCSRHPTSKEYLMN
ncbi:hypothetical protein KQX54_002877 [Cotesia glomerata]|uniref:Uncharacterized protein n=1 Tax=Cotesia glomerata TaxID=32391 RepID=A0AAV7J4Q4_COTGL|nr:hypothetical protein KQX54_002877 [Cotesia glomerata]